MPVDLDAIDAALAKMTAGPWEVDVRDRIIDSDGRLLLAVGDHCINAENDANAAGIVLLRNAAHALLAELRRWRMATFDATPDAVAQTVADLAWSAASEGNEAERLRADLAAARLDAANARSVAVEAIDLLDARLNPRTLEGYVFKDEAEAQLVTLRTRLASPADFAARVTAAGPARTIFECRCCARQVGGWSDGRFDDPAWGRIDHIDGPDAICPACIADGDALDDFREAYPNVAIRARAEVDAAIGVGRG